MNQQAVKILGLVPAVNSQSSSILEAASFYKDDLPSFNLLEDELLHWRLK